MSIMSGPKMEIASPHFRLQVIRFMIHTYTSQKMWKTPQPAAQLVGRSEICSGKETSAHVVKCPHLTSSYPQVVGYFQDTFAFRYSPEVSGAPADWLLDVLAIHFRRNTKGHDGFRSVQELEAAASEWKAYINTGSDLEEKGPAQISQGILQLS